ncbi:hypothetical protein NIES39_L03100 [Arthrospira platensis NIES-39]|nr:hypothetical protein NIES39_L03100 [Arthrospira platensis NIES-39]
MGGRVYVTGLLLQKTPVKPPLQGAGAGLCNWSVTTEDPGEPAPTGCWGGLM